jgi:hypothetical protein
MSDGMRVGGHLAISESGAEGISKLDPRYQAGSSDVSRVIYHLN